MALKTDIVIKCVGVQLKAKDEREKEMQSPEQGREGEESANWVGLLVHRGKRCDQLSL